MIDATAEIKKLEKSKAETEKDLERLNKKMAMPTYSTKVPEAVRQSDSERVSCPFLFFFVCLFCFHSSSFNH